MWKWLMERIRPSSPGVWDRFTDTTKRVIVWAQEDARDRNETVVAPEHLLAGLLLEQDSAAARTLERLDVSRYWIYADLEEQRPDTTSPQDEDFRLSPHAKRVMDLALSESSKSADATLCTAHLLLGLIRDGQSVASEVLSQHSVTWDKVCQATTGLQDDVPEEETTLQGKQMDRVNRLWQSAQAEAEARCEDRIRPDHLLSALLQDPDCLGSRVLDRLGLDLSRLPTDLEERRPSVPRNSDGTVIFSNQTRWVSQLVDEEVRLLQHDQITTGHVLLGLLREGTSVASWLLVGRGADLERARLVVAELHQDEPLPEVAEEPDESSEPPDTAP